MTIRRLLPTTVLLLALTSGGCAMLRRPAAVIDRSQDLRIASEVQARLVREPGIDAGRVRVEVDGGIVILHGSVQGIQGWQCAIRNAGLVDGVRSVTDFLTIERATVEYPCQATRREGT